MPVVVDANERASDPARVVVVVTPIIVVIVVVEVIGVL